MGMLRLMCGVAKLDMYRAAKLSLWNFLSLFRDLRKSTRFSGGGGSSRIVRVLPEADAWGGVVAEFYRDLQNPARFSGWGVA